MGENWVHTFGSNLGPHLGPRIWVRSRIPDIPAMATDRYNEAGTDWQRQQWRLQSFELAVHGKKQFGRKIIWAALTIGMQGMGGTDKWGLSAAAWSENLGVFAPRVEL